jgi:hypothetical protein
MRVIKLEIQMIEKMKPVIDSLWIIISEYNNNSNNNNNNNNNNKLISYNLKIQKK